MTGEYSVLKVTPMTRVADEGGIEKYYRVKYKTKGGVVDTVDVAEGDYNEKSLPPILLRAADKHDKILKL